MTKKSKTENTETVENIDNVIKTEIDQDVIIKDYGQKTLNVVLTANAADLDKLNQFKDGNWIFLWANPKDFAGIIEMNFRIRKIQNDNLEHQTLAELAILDLEKAGYPPIAGDAYFKELYHIADLYAEAGSKNYSKVKKFYFI